MTADPLVLMVPHKLVSGWPPKEGKAPGRAIHVRLSAALTGTFPTDAHVQLTGSPTPHRLRKAALAHLPEGVPITAFFVDVDGPDHAADDAWFAGERSKIEACNAAHPGVFAYRTRGGYRPVWTMPDRVIRTNDDAAAWRDFYHRSLLHLARDFGIVADPACADWTHLFRLPHATRDPKRGPERLETIGNPRAIGAWTYEPGPETLDADIATARELSDQWEASHV